MAENNGTYALGRIGLNTCGTYDATQNYERLDVVNYCGSSYIAKRANVGVAPAENGDWSLMAKGNLLIAGEDVPPIADYVLGEHLTGARWIDGKPIYRYVYYSTTSIPANLPVSLFTIANLDVVISIIGTVKYDNLDRRSIGEFHNTNDFVFCYIESGTSIKLFSKWKSSIETVVEVRYTKT